MIKFIGGALISEVIVWLAKESYKQYKKDLLRKKRKYNMR
jgi:hypothetical protein